MTYSQMKIIEYMRKHYERMSTKARNNHLYMNISEEMKDAIANVSVQKAAKLTDTFL